MSVYRILADVSRNMMDNTPGYIDSGTNLPHRQLFLTSVPENQKVPSDLLVCRMLMTDTAFVH